MINWQEPHYIDQLCGHELAKRALEIAITGSHTIVYLGSEDSDATSFAKLTNLWHNHVFARESGGARIQIAYERIPPPDAAWCYYSHQTYSRQRLVRWYDNEIAPLRAAMMVLVQKMPPIDSIMYWVENNFTCGENHLVIINRIKDNRNDTMILDTMADAAQKLLRASIQRYQFGLQLIRRICSVANTTAIMAGATQVEACHMAEAIQYAPVNVRARFEECEKIG